jgi:hypothetical protein
MAVAADDEAVVASRSPTAKGAVAIVAFTLPWKGP